MQNILLILLVVGYFLISIYDHLFTTKRLRALEREIILIMRAVYGLQKQALDKQKEE
jgi:hypothetical protein